MGPQTSAGTQSTSTRTLRIRGEKQHPDDHWLYYVAAAVGVPIIGYFCIYKPGKEEETKREK